MSHTNSTTNYGLPEFLSSDKPAWMADINTAFATIDTTMKANEDSASQANTDIGTMGLNLAPGYSNASTYDVGDIVMYNKRVYICDVAVTVPEAFDSAKWSYYRLSDAGETANANADLLGNTDISSVGDGTVTGAVIALNANLSNKQDKSWTELGRDLTTATLPSDFNEAIVYVYSSGYGVEFFLSSNAPTMTWYSGANTSGYVGASVIWNLPTRTLASPTINISGTQSTGNMMVVYR